MWEPRKKIIQIWQYLLAIWVDGDIKIRIVYLHQHGLVQ